MTRQEKLDDDDIGRYGACSLEGEMMGGNRVILGSGDGHHWETYLPDIHSSDAMDAGRYFANLWV